MIDFELIYERLQRERLPRVKHSSIKSWNHIVDVSTKLDVFHNKRERSKGPRIHQSIGPFKQTSPCSQKEKERIGILDEIFWVQGVSFLGSGIHLKKGEDLHTICALGPENTEITFWLSEHFHFSIAVQHLFILICTMYLVVQSNGHLRMFICVGQCNFTSSPT